LGDSLGPTRLVIMGPFYGYGTLKSGNVSAGNASAGNGLDKGTPGTRAAVAQSEAQSASCERDMPAQGWWGCC
jgi:hypothetical protein